MITDEQVKQAIKETAEGMLSGDPDYAAKCVTARDGSAVRIYAATSQRLIVTYRTSSGGYEIKYIRPDGNIFPNEENSLDLIPAKRMFKCLVCFDEYGNPFTAFDKNAFLQSSKWLTDPVEVVLQEKERA